MENFRSEITLKNEISDLNSRSETSFVKLKFMQFDQKIDFLFFYFLMFLQYATMFRLSSGQKTSEYSHKQFF